MGVKFGWARNKRYALLCICSIVVGLTATGCASVKLKVGDKGEQKETRQIGAKERTALLVATRELERTPWPKVTETSISTRMFGSVFGNDEYAGGVSREEALDSYLARVLTRPDPVQQVFRDSNVTLRQARQVAESGRLAATTIMPHSGDIGVLEDAILNVRKSREMYLAALKTLKGKGYDVAPSDRSDLKEAFSQTIRDIGRTADLVADRVSETKSVSQYAAQGKSVESN